MTVVPGFEIEAVFGCVPARTVSNMDVCSALAGREKAEAVVKTTGFAERRVAEPGQTVEDLMLPAARAALEGVDAESVGAVVAVTFSAPDRFPAVSVRMASKLGLPRSVAAFDVSMACSGYPYGLFAAAQLAAASGKRALLLDGDVQSAFGDHSDVNTVAVMGDAATATLIAPGAPSAAPARFAFLSEGGLGGALTCGSAGPVKMDGFGVFRFVAAEVSAFLKDFLSAAGEKPDVFVPHAANMYMVRQLAASIGLDGCLATAGDRFANTGSSSVPLALAASPTAGRALLAGFGAGLSASAALVDVPAALRRGVVEAKGGGDA